MKFESMYYREKTTDFYGKKGMSWHGAMMYSRYTAQQKNKFMLENPNKTLQPHHITYFDHISAGDCKQDYGAVLTYFEALVMKITETYPHIKRLFVQSDNARCYQKGELIVGLHKVCRQYGVKIVSFIHSGVQYGKGCINAHFATAMRHVIRYVNFGMDVITPLDLVKALKSKKGVTNCIVQLVGINRRKLQEFERKYQEAIKMVAKIGEHVETVFDNEENLFRVFQYSNYGCGVNINISDCTSLSKSYTPIEPVENTLNEENKEGDASNDFNDSSIEDILSEDDDPSFAKTTEANKKGLVSGCIVYGDSQSGGIRFRESTTAIEKLDVESDDENPLPCATCKKRFSTKSNNLQHKYTGLVGKRDLVRYAMRYAYERIDQKEFEVLSMNTDAQIISAFDELPDTPEHAFQEGWAKTQPHGSKYEKKYIEPFKANIERLFLA